MNNLIKNNAVKIIAAVAFTLLTAYAGYLFTDTNSIWFSSLIKPMLYPPPMVFIVVWGVLYLSLAVSFALSIINPAFSNWTLLLYILNGVLNVFWCYVFFYEQQPVPSCLVLIVLIMITLLLSANVYKINKVSAYLLTPYILWLAFALCLNYEFAFLN